MSADQPSIDQSMPENLNQAVTDDERPEDPPVEDKQIPEATAIS